MPGPHPIRSRLVVALAGLWSLPAAADYALNLTAGVTSISREAYRLHMIVLWLCVGIAVVVFGAMLWAVVRHRKARGAIPAQFHDNTRLEIAWTAIPFLILVALAVPATQALIAMEDTADADLTIKVTGQQWRWRYDYLDEGIGFFSTLDDKSAAAGRKNSGVDPRTVDHYLLAVDNPLVVPVGKKIRFLTTATDVIHSWWLTALGYKKDAMPGFINEIWARIDAPGTYRGQCAELCGVGHAMMPIVVVAKSDADYQSWLAGMKATQAAAAAAATRAWSKDELMAKGQQVYNTMCIACHQPGGEGIPGVFKPLKGSAIAAGPLAAHMDRVMNGVAGTAMQAFAKQLSDEDIAAVITFERNAWGNAAGDLVQPGQIKAARK